MSKLVQRMRKARESVIDIGDHRLTIIRPTIEQMVEHKVHGFSHLELAKTYAVNWQDVREVDIVQGGATDLLDFDHDIWCEWLADNPDWWIPVGQAVLDSFNSYAEQKGEAVKN